jgi:hypothetical protein
MYVSCRERAAFVFVWWYMFCEAHSAFLHHRRSLLRVVTAKRRASDLGHVSKQRTKLPFFSGKGGWSLSWGVQLSTQRQPVFDEELLTPDDNKAKERAYNMTCISSHIGSRDQLFTKIILHALFHPFLRGSRRWPGGHGHGAFSEKCMMESEGGGRRRKNVL